MHLKKNKKLLTRWALALSLMAYAGVSGADPIERVQPTIQKEQLCWSLVRRHGWRSQLVNSDWRGRGTLRPSTSNWELSHTSRNWTRTRLDYGFVQETADGFEHEVYCTFYRSDGNYELRVAHHTYASRIICDRYEVSEHRC